jgi:hypothetical protein
VLILLESMHGEMRLMSEGMVSLRSDLMREIHELRASLEARVSALEIAVR